MAPVRLLALFTATTLSCLMLASQSQASEIFYKCTKENGTVSYLEAKPSAGCVNVEEVKIIGASNKGTPSAQQGNKDSGNTAAQKSVEEQEIADRKAKLGEACETKKANLETLKSSAAVSTVGPDGQTKALTSEEVQQQIKDTEKYISDYCSGG